MKNNTKRHNPALSNQCNILTTIHFFLIMILSLFFTGTNTHHPIRITLFLSKRIPLDLIVINGIEVQLSLQQCYMTFLVFNIFLFIK